MKRRSFIQGNILTCVAGLTATGSRAEDRLRKLSLVQDAPDKHLFFNENGIF